MLTIFVAVSRYPAESRRKRSGKSDVARKRGLALQPDGSPHLRQLSDTGATSGTDALSNDVDDSDVDIAINVNVSHNQPNLISIASDRLQSPAELLRPDLRLRQISGLREVARSAEFRRTLRSQLDQDQLRQGLGVEILAAVRDVMSVLDRGPSGDAAVKMTNFEPCGGLRKWLELHLSVSNETNCDQ